MYSFLAVCDSMYCLATLLQGNSDSLTATLKTIAVKFYLPKLAVYLLPLLYRAVDVGIVPFLQEDSKDRNRETALIRP